MSTALSKTPVNEKFGLMPYLNAAPLEGVLPLSLNGDLYFHWANWEECSRYLRPLVQDDGCTLARLEALENKLSELKDIPIWVRGTQKTIEATLHDLYEYYLDSRIRLNWYHSSRNLLLSFHGQAGPYQSLLNLRWFNSHDYQGMVYKKILQSNMPLRAFRLNCRCPIICEFNQNPFERTKVTLHQLTRNGIVVKVKGPRDMFRFIHSNKTMLYFDLSGFEYLNQLDEDQLRTALKENALSRFIKEANDPKSAIGVNRQVFQKGHSNQAQTKDEHTYFFIPFDEMNFSHPGQKEIVQRFVLNIRNLLEEEFHI